MSSDSPSLSQTTRSKLHLAVGGGAKDNCSLHRWVLLKNSIFRSQPSPAAPVCTKADVNPVYATDHGEEDEEVCLDEEHDSFMFPDVIHTAGAHVDSMEEQWFDSLYETLEVDEEDAAVSNSLLQVDDDDDFTPFTPSTSPMSSSDDLTIHPVYNDPPISMPYPVVYPPFHPPLLGALDIKPLTPLDSSYPPFNVALPYYDADDIDDLSVPDAIEDVSDDESDVLSTPSMTRSPVSSLLDPVSSSLLGGEGIRRRVTPQVFVGADTSCFYGFELDPLPFPDDLHNPSHMFNSAYEQEC
ncbi:hypothetical protein BV25DRAFT_661834 [Artomyces pyxidatus]|uniref:Uncharacterized protein n=1 Tax=Artomyces pyxidatus TaxID=48021 RepID=A0ACB8T2A5_9AGAM|nr:hypothetical protein BV25DRAFT_661834 [Artomyces pyxidatus]